MPGTSPADPPRLRLAPSPTGDLHVGAAWMALFDLAFARRHGGQFVIRIEDTDQARAQVDSEQSMLDSLRWLGLDWDEGPDKGGPYGPYRQSERLPRYAAYARQLVEQGQAYYCTCTPERLAALRQAQMANKQPPSYDRHCRELGLHPGQSEPHVIRMKVPLEGESVAHDLVRGELRRAYKDSDDQVILKADGFPTYHLAVVVDDHDMRISHVVRGEEWISSLPKHLLLYQYLGWEPPLFAHMPLLRNADKSKISKRKHHTSMQWYERQGYLPEAMINFLAMLGWSMPDGRELFTFADVMEHFTFERVVTSSPVFSLEKLQSINGQYIRALDIPALAERMVQRPYVLAQLPLVRERMRTLNEFHPLTAFFYEDVLAYEPQLLVPKKAVAADVPPWLAAARDLLRDFRPWRAGPLEEALRALLAENGWATGQVFMSLRVALTASTQSPPLTETMEVLGREKTLQRLDAALQALA
ncbi:MAG TPA: glutamate--tRNA ligase [Chloroflexota bacterium]|nr:glutamate--tRNA ligase [Chloroflexota bacterium]